MIVKATTRYLGPSRGSGASIQVQTLGHTRNVPYDYTAKDPYLSAASRVLSSVLGVTVMFDDVRLIKPRDNGYVFGVEVEVKVVR